MNFRGLVLVACATLVCGCTPKLIRYMHVVVAEGDRLKVVERSTESNDSQGKPLSARKVGLPTKVTISGNGYILTLSMPVNSSTAVFLKAEDENKRALDLRGKHLAQIDQIPGVNREGYRYAFLVREAQNAPMDFDVVTKEGVVLAHENLTYDVISRGYVWDIDAL